MRRGLVVLLGLYSSWSLADTRAAEVCRGDSSFVREINRASGEVLIDVDGDAGDQRRAELLEILRDHHSVINLAGDGAVGDLINAIIEDGAIVSAGLKGTAPDCVNVVAGHDAWTRLSSSEIAGR